MSDISLRFLTILLVVVGCQREPPAPEPAAQPAPSESKPHTDEARHEMLPRKVKLSEAVMREAKLQIGAATREVLSETLSLSGEVATDPDRLARISSPTAGRIEEVRFKEGALVKKGDALVVLRVPEIGKVRSAFSATASRAAAARTKAERLHELLAERLATQQDAVDAKAEADALDVEARSLNEQLGALGAGASGAFAITLRAPITGSVLSRDAVVGQPVSPEQTLGSIADLEQVWFLGRVFEKDLGRLTLGAGAEVRLNAYPNERFSGSIEYIGQQVDAAARAVTARIRLKNRDDLLRIGLFGSAEVALNSAAKDTPRLVVPRSAVTEIADKPVVFVREQDGDFELHEVTLGRAAPGKIEILAGLREGEPVVTEGVFSLKSIVLKGSFAEAE
jgi:cobalt-zinc-cadmium efflux system membrane fusion protein